MTRFRAAVLETPGARRPYARSRPLAVETVEVPPPSAGEVLVRIRAASLCRSDLAVVTGVRPWPLPIVPGHEATGVVEAVGPAVASVAPGEPVVLVFLTQCGACRPCLEGRPWICEAGTAANRQGRLLTGGPRLSRGGRPVHHHMGISAFAERALVSERSVVRVPADLPPDVACLFGCAVMCGAGTVLHTAGVRPGQSVAVVGLGGVGLAAVMGAVLAGATRIVGVDPAPAKRALALAVGATDAVDAAAGDAAEAVRALVPGGVDHAVEAAGTPAAFDAAFRATRRGGTTVTLGLPGATERFPLPLAQVVAEARVVKGSYLGSCVPARDIPAFAALHRQGRLPVERLVTGTLALEGLNEALDRLADGEVLRQVVVFG